MNCPKCGRDGKPAIKKVKSKGREYWYSVFRHPDGVVCIVGKLSDEEALSKRVRAAESRRQAYELAAAAFLIDLLGEELAHYRKMVQSTVEIASMASRLTELYVNQLARLTGFLNRDKAYEHENASDTCEICSSDHRHVRRVREGEVESRGG
ncbi:MAG: hypothetical protein NZ954_02410 [Thermofilaceae archaeon]|nr:hypothetical protein [Thermofilaceae archaeon]MCX8181254.1 hypothetical protein [Thermofilaceae archaeon]MDW8003527.1 hypothetical protein [Thermofilaceae archaeon]